MKQKEDISDEFYDEKLRKLFALEPVISKKIIRKHGMDLRRSSSKEIYK